MDDEEEKADNGDAAITELEFLEKLMGIGAGIEYAAGPRTDSSISNKELLKIHAYEGVNRRDGRNIKRNLFPGDKDTEKMAQSFVSEVDKHMERVGQETKSGKTVTAENASKQAAASGLKKAAVIYAETLARNLVNQTNSDGTPLERVEEKYGQQRLMRWNVSENVAMVKTGQLGKSIANGKYTLFYSPEKVNDVQSVSDSLK